MCRSLDVGALIVRRHRALIVDDRSPRRKTGPRREDTDSSGDCRLVSIVVLEHRRTLRRHDPSERPPCRPLPRPSCQFLGSVAWREMVAKDIGGSWFGLLDYDWLLVRMTTNSQFITFTADTITYKTRAVQPPQYEDAVTR